MFGQSVVIRSAILLSLLLASIAESQPIAYQLCYPVSPLRHPSADHCPNLPTGLISCPVELQQVNPIPPEYDEYYNSQCYLEWNEAYNGYHTGDDWNGIQGASNDLGAPIFAIGDGELVYMEDRGDGEEHEWGKVIVLRHEYFTGDIFYSLYAHLGEFLLPPLGGYDVKMGEQIATLGDGNGFYSMPDNCGGLSGCAHLHFEIRKELGSIPEIIPGPGYATPKDSPFILDNYHSPSEFIEARRAQQCPASVQAGPSSITNAACPPPPGQAPEVSTLSPSNITNASAEFRLSVNPGSLDTDAWFEWDDDQNLANETTRFYVGSGSTSTTYSYTQSGLSCDTNYYFRAHAENREGADDGDIIPFRTDDCSSGGGGGGGADDLIRNGDFEDEEDYWTASDDFHANSEHSNYNFSPGYAFLALADGSPANNLAGRIYQEISIPSNVETAILGYWYSISTQENTGGSEFDRLSVVIEDPSASILDVVAAYSDNDDTGGAYFYDSFDLSHRAGEDIEIHFLGITDESLPTVFRVDDVSLDITFPVGEAPTVSTLSANLVRDSSARLNLEVIPGGLDTDVWFEWDDDTNLSDETDRITVGNGTSHQDISITLHGLDCDTTYYFAAFAENDAGDDEGSQRSFRTDDCPGGEPTADTDPAIDITSSSATLTADILPNGRSTEAWFEWGTSGSLGSSTSRQGVGSGTSWRDFEQTLGGLDCETTYYFEANAENSAGEDDGSILSFTTSDCGSGGGGGGGGSGSGDSFLAWAERQSCSGTNPAVLLRWEPVEGADAFYLIERTDGGYSAAVDTSSDGFAHLVSQGFEYDHTYDFVVTAETVEGSRTSSAAKAFITDRICSIGGTEGPPGQFTLWIDPWRCPNGNLETTVHWSTAAGSDNYNLRRYDELGGQDVVVANIPGTRYLDSTDFDPGYQHVYRITAINPQGGTESFDGLSVYPDPSNCSGYGFPREFDLTSGEPYCLDGEPAIPIQWSESSGAGTSYRYRVRRQAGRLSGGGMNTTETGFNYSATAGVKPGQVNEIFLISEGWDDSTKRALSNSAYLFVPFDICGEETLPSVWTSDVVGVTSESAILRGNGRANGSDAVAHFEWGATAALGNQSLPVSIGDTAMPVFPTARLEDLSCGTEYFYRLVATNITGSSFGEHFSFTTDDCQAPAVETFSASSMTTGEATLSMRFYSDDPNTTAWFEWGPSVELGGATQEVGFGSIQEPWYFSQRLTGLMCENTYYYRAVAENADGVGKGATLSLETADCTLPNAAPTISIQRVMPGTSEMWFIAFSASDPDDDARISLSYSHDSDCSSPLVISPYLIEGYDYSYTWNPAGLVDGEYYVLAEIYDGEYQAADCMASPVPVQTGTRLLLRDDFETGDISKWDAAYGATDGSSMVTAEASLVGDYGLELDVVPCTAEPDLLIDGEVLDGTQDLVGCDSIQVSDTSVLSTASVELRSGGSVVFGNGFRVESNGQLRVFTDQDGIGARLVEDRGLGRVSSYGAEFLADLSSLTLDGAGYFELFVAYNAEGDVVFKVPVWYEETQASWMASVAIRPWEGAIDWWQTSPIEVAGGLEILEIGWIDGIVYDGSSENQGRVSFCAYDRSRGNGGCSFQYLYLLEKVDRVKFGVMHASGEVGGSARIDNFVSWTDED